MERSPSFDLTALMVSRLQVA